MAVAFVVLVGLVSGLLAANAMWTDPRDGRRVVPTVASGLFLAFVGGSAAWALLLLIDLAIVKPIALLFVAGALYLLVAVNVAWDQFRRHGGRGGVFSALLVGICWLPLMVLLRRV
jgi:hypothetical protein